MSAMCRHLTTTRSAVHRRRGDLVVKLQIRNNSDSAIPVKLAYVSYEAMNGDKNSAHHPIIVMHGLFGSKTNWSSLSKAIHQRTKRKVITVDARNHGDSPHSPEMTYRHMAQDILQLTEDLGFEKSVLVGHSMGGSTMMYVALHNPQLVEKLVVVDISPVRMSPQLIDVQKIMRAMSTVNFEGITTLTKARSAMREQLAKVVPSFMLRQFLAMNVVEADVGKFKWRINLPVLERAFENEIAVFPNVGSKVYDGPTLFIGGGNSDFIRLEDHVKIKRLFPAARFTYIKDARHWVHADKPAEFLKATIDFINQS